MRHQCRKSCGGLPVCGGAALVLACCWFDLAAAAFYEVDAASSQDGLGPLLQKYLEPFGALCLAYVDPGSRNLALLQRLGRLEESKEDAGLAHLQVPIVAAVGWREPGNESLVMTYRKPFQRVWSQMGMTVMDEHDVIFAGKHGVAWKEAAVRKWLFANAFPTINVRVMDRKEDEFPEGRYTHPASNDRAAALVFMNLTGNKEVSAQLKMAGLLRSHAERLKDRVRFSFAERTKATRTIRQLLGVGVDFRHEAEMVLLERPGFFPTDRDEMNHWHGDPKKYRLRNFTEEAIEAFFAGFERGALPTHWVTKESWTWGGKPRPAELAWRLTGEDFEVVVLDEDAGRGRLVAFFNDAEEDNCMRCADGRAVWESVAKAVKLTRSLSGRVLVASIDQSQNEHPETLVAAKVAQPMVVWYPPGSRAHRWRKRRVLTGASASFTKDNILEELEDILIESADSDEL